MHENKSSFAALFAERYPRWRFLIRYFRQATSLEPEWSNLTPCNLRRFVDYLRSRFAPNTVNQYASRFRVVLNMSRGMLPADFGSVLSPRSERIHHIFLTETEISLFMKVDTRSPREELVKTLFLVGILTLARHSDYSHFDPADIRGEMLEYVSRKTRVIARIPATPTLRDLLERMQQLRGREVGVSNVGFNLILRRLGRRAGISDRVRIYKAGRWIVGEKWQFLSSHTARRSAITNLYLRGVDLETIACMAGHGNTSTTRRYICCDLRPIPAKAAAFFAAF